MGHKSNQFHKSTNALLIHQRFIISLKSFSLFTFSLNCVHLLCANVLIVLCQLGLNVNMVNYSVSTPCCTPWKEKTFTSYKVHKSHPLVVDRRGMYWPCVFKFLSRPSRVHPAEGNMASTGKERHLRCGFRFSRAASFNNNKRKVKRVIVQVNISTSVQVRCI